MEEREKSSVNIPENKEDVSNIYFLKEKGIETLQELTGKNWTDYNVHDPGITILEIVCFALTELGYRSGYPIENLFAPKSDDKNLQSSNFAPHDILVSGAITNLDYRKIILDIEGVNNVEFKPANNIFEFKGIFDVFVELENHNISKAKRKNIENQIRQSLSDNRGICVHFNDIFFLESEFITLDINIELNKKIDTAEFLFELVKTIENYFSPAPTFKTVDALMDFGVNVDDIYLGPLLKNGFIRDDELIEHELRKNVYVSDILNIVMSLDGVHHIKKMNITNDLGEEFNWIYKVRNKCIPRLDISKSKVSVSYKGKHAYSVALLDFFPDNVSFKTKIGNAHKSNKIKPLKGKAKELKAYTSIVNDFPEIYGLSKMGMPEGATKEAVASTKQLRVYLMFFDQIMANYLAQLDHLKYLFSLNELNTTNAIQILEDFPGVYYVYKPFLDKYLIEHQDLNDELSLRRSWKKYINHHREDLESFVSKSKEDNSIFLKRRNRILDHLLARYGYDYSSFDVVSLLNEKELIQVKTDLLKNLCSLGYSRFTSSKETSQILHSSSGYERHFCFMFGFQERNDGLISERVTKSLNLKDTQTETLQIDFTDINRGEAIQKLLFYGLSISNYKSSKEKISIDDVDGNTFCQFSFSKKFKLDYQKTIGNVMSSIYELSRKSEAFYFIEHSLLRPSDAMSVYGLNINIGSDVIFASDSFYPRHQRDEITDLFKSSLCDSDSYEIIEISMNQFKLKWSSGSFTLFSTHFFNSEPAAQLKLNEYLSAFQSDEEIEDFFTRTTIFNSLYNEIADPFSNIVSFIFPDWPHRFQNEAFNNYILEHIKLGLPAHIVPNVIWLSLDDMIYFENIMLNYFKHSNKSADQQFKELQKILSFLNSN